MSLYRELDGDVESLPNLIDEEELLFGGGEDLFEFLDEESTEEPVAVVSRSEPLGYTLPLFFPFGKSEPTPPTLKLQGVSSFKKINNRLHQGGELSDTKEIAAVGELERALAVLGHQKRFLSEQKSQLEMWTSAVYGSILASPDSAGDKLDVAPSDCDADDDVGLSDGKQEEHGGQEDDKNKREIRVHLKCEGAEKRCLGALVARVEHTWRPRSENNAGDGTKRASSFKLTAEKPPKRSKPSETKSELAKEEDTTPKGHDVEEFTEQDQTDVETLSGDDVPESPGRIWSWLEDRSYFSPISRRQPLTEDLTLEAECRLGRSTLIPLQCSAGDTRKGPENDGVRRDVVEESTDSLRQRLLSALVVPGSGPVEDACKSGVPGTDRNMGAGRTGQTSEGSPRVLDVTHLSLEQRVLVQLCGVGLLDNVCHEVGSRPTKQPGLIHSQRNLAERITKLNRCKVVLRREINATT